MIPEHVLRIWREEYGFSDEEIAERSRDLYQQWVTLEAKKRIPLDQCIELTRCNQPKRERDLPTGQPITKRIKAKHLTPKKGSPPVSRDELEALYEDYSSVKIAERFNVSRQTVLNWMARYGIDKKDKHRNRLKCPRDMTKSDFLDLLSKYTLREMAQQFGASEYIISRWAVELGISKEEQKEALWKKRSTKYVGNEPPSRDTLRDLYKKMPIQEIAKIYGVHWSTARKWMIRYGLKRESGRRSHTSYKRK